MFVAEVVAQRLGLVEMFFFGLEQTSTGREEGRKKDGGRELCFFGRALG